MEEGDRSDGVVNVHVAGGFCWIEVLQRPHKTTRLSEWKDN